MDIFQYGSDGEVKNPSIDITGDEIILVYESRWVTDYTIEYMKWDVTSPTPGSQSVIIASIAASYFGQAYPVVAYTYHPLYNTKELFAVYRTSTSGGLKYSRRLYLNGTQTESQNEVTLPETDFQSKYPSIAGSKISNSLFIAYESSQRYVKCQGYDYNAPFKFYATQTISTGSGYRYNYAPSISLFGVLLNETVIDFRPIVSWAVSDFAIAKSGNEQTANETKIAIRPNNGSTWGSILLAGSLVSTSQNGSTTNSNSESVIVWSENTGASNKWIKRINGTYNTTKCLSPSGKGLLISNGTGLTNMKALVFNDNTLPYSFNKSADNFYLNIECGSGGGELGKITEAGSITFGRSGLVLKNGVEFIFNIGDVVINDSVIQFIEVHDTIQYQSAAEINAVVRTNLFELSNDAEFIFSNLYYVNNIEFADTSLSTEDAVTFKAELVNAVTGNVAGTFDNITYDKNNLEKYENISYQVNCSGIQPGAYYLRLVTTVNGEADYNLANVQSDASELEKKTFTTIYFDGSGLPEVYNISQNYPNPFNPSTVINYQIPKDGLVTFKVYDILGKEVTTLVNENKSVGRYSVQFNGENLASGVYIYRINSGDFVSSKKMMLIK